MKNKKTTLVLLLCSLVMLTGSGCCTIISGSTQDIPISSTPPGATVTADDGTSITTPGTLVLKRKTAHTLVAEYPGHEQQQKKLKKKLNNWVWGNILFGGIIGLAIDMVSGAVNELKPNPPLCILPANRFRLNCTSFPYKLLIFQPFTQHSFFICAKCPLS